MTTPDIFELLRRARWDRLFHSWSSFHSFLIPLVAWLVDLWRRAVKRRNARLAQNWSVAEGRVQSVNVATQAAFFGMKRQYNATFTYSYSVHDGSETSYYSGGFARLFADKDGAWEWLHSVKDKQIRVHVQPGRPEVSVVLAGDLDAHFPLPLRMPDGLKFPAPRLQGD
jgi:hypothetical protein